MEISSDFELLVVHGGWNKHILTQEWVRNFLMPNTEFLVEYPFDYDNSLRFSTDELRMFIAGNKLNFSVRKADDEVLKKIENYAQKIADYLPHTPVKFYIVNFIYSSSSNRKLDDLFQFNDSEALKNDLSENEETTITRSFRLTDYNFNLRFSKRPGKDYLILFNYHFQIENLVDFKGKIDEFGILKLKSHSLDFLKKHYNLNFERND